ncbi:hypothetical protein [Terrimonas alba]|uniref:hypothetical protein n=1 Tax=Terrimonas alba TaxID=3349636 RepID=UPI0035F2CD2F
MKKILLGIAAGLMSIYVFSQQKEPVQALTKQDYLQKSKNQKTIGWVLLGGGTIMAVVGAITFNSTYDSDSYTATDAGGFLLLGGIVADLASIPFFIGSAKNARKAATISFNNQRILIPHFHSLVAKAQPSVTIKIGI